MSFYFPNRNPPVLHCTYFIHTHSFVLLVHILSMPIACSVVCNMLKLKKKRPTTSGKLLNPLQNSFTFCIYPVPLILISFPLQHNARPTPSPSSLDFFAPPRLTHYFQFDFKLFLMLLPAQNVLHLLSKHVLIAFVPGTILPTYPSGPNVKRPLSQLSTSKILMPSSVPNGDTGG